jgi:hypothetical protein
VTPLEFFTVKVAPVSEPEDIKYARFVCPEPYPIWLTRTKADCADAVAQTTILSVARLIVSMHRFTSEGRSWFDMAMLLCGNDEEARRSMLAASMPKAGNVYRKTKARLAEPGHFEWPVRTCGCNKYRVVGKPP